MNGVTMAGIILAVCIGGLLLVAVLGIVSNVLERENRQRAAEERARIRRACQRLDRDR